MTINQIITLRLKTLGIETIEFTGDGTFYFEMDGRSCSVDSLDVLKAITIEDIMESTVQFSCCGVEIDDETLRCPTCMEGI